MTPVRDLVKSFRHTIQDTDSQEYLWDDTAVLRCLNQAQHEFFKRMGGKPYSWKAEFDDDGVLIVDDVLLEIKNITDSEGSHSCAAKYPIVSEVTKKLRQGFLGEGTKFTWFSRESDPPPTDLTVYARRLPLEDITSLDSMVETHKTHHHCLIWYAMAEAYRTQNTETFDKSKTYELEVSFYRYVTEMKAKYIAKKMIQI